MKELQEKQKPARASISQKKSAAEDRIKAARQKTAVSIDEIRKRLEQLVSNQDNLDQQIRSINKRTDPSVFKRLSQEQKINEKEFAKIMKEMNKSIDGIKKFSRKTAQNLEGLSESKDAELS